MRARAGWVKAMNENLATANFEAVKKDATALSSQTAAAAEKQPAGLAKELTLKLSSFALATAEAAGTKNGDGTKMKLAEAQSVCAECHAKIRDKK
jgi:mono/diheme cytochrome c family protein